jgi:hypothetical protein
MKLRDSSGNIIEVMAVRGPSAYDLAKANGFEGSVTDWLNTFYLSTDSEMSDTSDNLVTNGAIKAYINELFVEEGHDKCVIPVKLSDNKTLNEFSSMYYFTLYLDDTEKDLTDVYDIKRILIRRINGTTSGGGRMTVSVDVKLTEENTYDMDMLYLTVDADLTDFFQHTTNDPSKIRVEYYPEQRYILLGIHTGYLSLTGNIDDYVIECYR